MTDRARTRFQALVDSWRIQSDGTLDLERGRLLNRCADDLSALLVQPETERQGLLIDRDAILRNELRAYLDGLTITGDNIGEIRRSLFMPWDSPWNDVVREETANRERAAMPERG